MKKLKQILLITVALFLAALNFKAQEAPKKMYIGFGFDVNLSNNGHGGFYAAHLTMSKGRNSFRLGPCMHKRSMQLTGGRLSYSYILAGMDGEEQLGMGFPESNNGSWRISLFSYLQYVNNTQLGYQRVKEETSLTQDSIPRNWNDVKLSTLEGAIGAEIDLKILNYIQWRSYVGIGLYSYLNPVQGMYQEQTGLMFMVGTGIDIPSFKKKKK
ncbi:MAG: hypothetical protein KA163_10975 [Bacteroidia bacterium]|nr:hypothetical protein [Bacteroidia bacterium]